MEALALQPGNHKVGEKLLTQSNQDPIYVSPGHRVSIEEAVAMTLKATPWYRMPQPLLIARDLVEKFRDAEEGV